METECVTICVGTLTPLWTQPDSLNGLFLHCSLAWYGKFGASNQSQLAKITHNLHATKLIVL